MTPPKSPIVRLIGVYDAEGTLRGEISYLFRRTFSGHHCALCDITHGAVRRRQAWKKASAEFSSRHGIDIHLAHLDDAPRSVLDHEDFRAPMVYLERLDGTVEPLMTAADLEKCARSPEVLFGALEDEVANKQ